MRKKRFAHLLKKALIVVPLLAGSGTSAFASGLTLPDCLDGQLIGINSDKTLACVSVPPESLTVPNCLPDTQVLTSLTDSVTGKTMLSCISRGTGLNDIPTTTRIMNATTNVLNLQSILAMITTGSGTRPRYVGATTATANGAIVSGASSGARAASKLCEADYGVGTHMCTPFEIYESLIIGDRIDGTTNVGPLMVYLEAWVPPFATGGLEPTAGLAESCGGQTVASAAAKWHNTFFTFAVPTGGTVRVAKFDATIDCSVTAKIACCK